MATRTSKRTLYRLRGVTPTVDGMFDALDASQLERVHADFDFPENLGGPAVLVTGSFEQSVASWCDEIFRTTGIEVARPVNRSAGLLMLAVDGEVYAIGYDQGFRLVPDRLKDHRFGLSFASRRVDPTRIRDVVSHTPGGGRTDITLVPGGASVWSLGIVEHAQIVRRLGGHLDGIPLTISRDNPARIFSAEGGAGLRLRLGVEGADLIADIRAIARVLREEKPSPELEFVEHVVPVDDPSLVTRLEAVLDDLLGQEPDGRIGVAVPADHWDDYTAAQTFRARINSDTAGRATDDLDLGYVLCRARIQRAGRRVTALREGTVTLYRHSRADRADEIWTSSALRWIEAEVSLGSHRYFLMDEHWYEIDQAYLKVIRSHAERLMTRSSSVDLPPWVAGETERTYNASVPDQRPGYVCFDRDNVRTALHRGNGVEICDLLGPDDALIMVKRAKGSDALSHLFSQALVAVQTLRNSPEGRQRFTEKVATARKGNGLPEDFRPSKVVFAILLKDGTDLTADTLFPFSQVTLVQTARTLEAWGVRVEVVGITSTPAVVASLGIRRAAA
ncbi:TIGR04141 family sporadically distributed protein [Streptomyces europaeiscabiei]|uniref:TIGR04141 family sporadically distributed protein n=1 Tax=Streptomyces europaeiscabiei TaxID=146819 RepID=UPI0029AF8FD0|nr:TIGR04141 family sporadically distributed protein [Streptomyces europaeiscabiei]MDX2771799.1 TIGR04141 family sporadically distributed protein [Streptomyces europaeiscabiei]MDX3830988.1 TIGR04141 family sporadically distributed protein [Streptomyces europaeiscabiei]